MQEKREHPRLKDKLTVVCEIPECSKFEYLENRQDLSAGGIKISIPKKASK